MHSRNDAPGDLAGGPTALTDRDDPHGSYHSSEPVDPVLAERHARRRRAVAAAAVAVVFLGGTGCLQWQAAPWPF
ncbi:hypothetical protein NGB36_18670 [Streptomyces sp. RB6PN25]|uniref:Uncharacterized protein n=1 Tax=Streptomyces humicola TaxID=2953240 RepID=A0ABT1PZT2_9ACTN|nr:hypothetical protein [Streptomyces humicola]MCQ4082570.1 hypothetical protein [Streptomyces humicola]